MNLQQLRVFVLTVQEQKLIVVAERLGITQPTVSFHLNKLQEELGLPLFMNGTYRVLTEAGRLFYPYARQMAGLEEESRKAVSDLRELRAGRLAIGATYTPATYLLPACLARFRETYPSIQIKMEVNTAGVLLEMIRNYELDLAILSNVPPEDETLTLHPLYKDELIVVANPLDTWLRNTRDPLRPEDFVGIPLVMHEEGSMTRRIIETWARENRIPLSIVLEVSATETMKEMAKMRLGAAILSERCCRKELATGELLGRPLPNFNLSRQRYLVHRRDKQRMPAMQAFMDSLPDQL